MLRQLLAGALLAGAVLGASNRALGQSTIRQDRASVSQKGSLLIFPVVEIKWDVDESVTQDTILTLANDYPEDVYVQLYLVNGDPPLEAVFDEDTGEIIEPEHPGWNWADCQLLLTVNQPTYWSALTGLPAGCQPFTALDDSVPMGRPDLEGPPGSRVLRGFLVAWAVDVRGHEVRWNHLSGGALTVDYAGPTAWEYNAYAFQARSSEHGQETDQLPGQLRLDGFEYDVPYEKLFLNFYAVGAQFITGSRSLTAIDTDLTLMPVSVDLRQDSLGPITTKAKWDIWNMNETRFSGTQRCITCWDQTLMSDYEVPNNFLRQHLQTDVGKARIDGIASTRCDTAQCPDNTSDLGVCSVNAAILGVANKMLAIEGTSCANDAAAGATFVGMGQEPAMILYDIVAPPTELRSPGADQIERLSEPNRPSKQRPR